MVRIPSYRQDFGGIQGRLRGGGASRSLLDNATDNLAQSFSEIGKDVFERNVRQEQQRNSLWTLGTESDLRKTLSESIKGLQQEFNTFDALSSNRSYTQEANALVQEALNGITPPNPHATDLWNIRKNQILRETHEQAVRYENRLETFALEDKFDEALDNFRTLSFEEPVNAGNLITSFYNTFTATEGLMPKSKLNALLRDGASEIALAAYKGALVLGDSDEVLRSLRGRGAYSSLNKFLDTNDRAVLYNRANVTQRIDTTIAEERLINDFTNAKSLLEQAGDLPTGWDSPKAIESSVKSVFGKDVKGQVLARKMIKELGAMGVVLNSAEATLKMPLIERQELLEALSELLTEPTGQGFGDFANNLEDLFGRVLQKDTRKFLNHLEYSDVSEIVGSLSQIISGHIQQAIEDPALYAQQINPELLGLSGVTYYQEVLAFQNAIGVPQHLLSLLTNQQLTEISERISGWTPSDTLEAQSFIPQWRQQLGEDNELYKIFLRQLATKGVNDKWQYSSYFTGSPANQAWLDASLTEWKTLTNQVPELSVKQVNLALSEHEGYTNMVKAITGDVLGGGRADKIRGFQEVVSKMIFKRILNTDEDIDDASDGVIDLLNRSKVFISTQRVNLALDIGAVGANGAVLNPEQIVLNATKLMGVRSLWDSFLQKMGAIHLGSNNEVISDKTLMEAFNEYTFNSGQWVMNDDGTGLMLVSESTSGSGIWNPVQRLFPDGSIDNLDLPFELLNRPDLILRNRLKIGRVPGGTSYVLGSITKDDFRQIKPQRLQDYQALRATKYTQSTRTLRKDE